MGLFRFVFASMLPVLAAAEACYAAGEKDKPTEPPKEQNVVAHDSKSKGALQVNTVNKKSSEWFVVAHDGKSAISGAPPVLNSTVELAPGAYVVTVNRTERKVTIDVGKKTILWTGEIMVEGKRKGDFYAPFQGKERRLATVEPLVNTPTALFAGKYTVKVFGSMPKDLGEAEVTPGKRTVLKQ
nr:hypothetical protein Hi04_10k_c2220_00034 [uncultured bacterium]